MIKDSGERTVFKTGAVRDIKTAEKGRCDLLPLDVVSAFVPPEKGAQEILRYIAFFQESGIENYLLYALDTFLENAKQYNGWADMLLDVAVHYSEGCEKYAENNWKLGIPCKSYIDSAVRHVLKWYRGDNDERHDRAFVWNILGCVWTAIHLPELNEYKKQEAETE